MSASFDGEFAEFATARAGALYRSAWLLCGNGYDAEDLVQETLAKLYVAWGRRWGAVGNPAAYAQRTLVRTFISGRRKRSSRELPTDSLPEAADDNEDVALRVTLAAALAELKPLDRAVLVLRYFDDQPVERVAELLNLSSGAVRNRAMRALTTIRTLLGPAEEHTKGARP